MGPEDQEAAGQSLIEQVPTCTQHMHVRSLPVLTRCHTNRAQCVEEHTNAELVVLSDAEEAVAEEDAIENHVEGIEQLREIATGKDTPRRYMVQRALLEVETWYWLY
jgi:hypothetical protein